MINIENILAASEIEIATATKNIKGHRIVNLVKEGDVYRALSKQKVDGEFLLSAYGMEDQAVSIEWDEGVCYISGINSEVEMILAVSIQKDESALLRAVHEKLKGLKAGEEVIKDPFFIVGPPGTGKTKTISQIVEEAIAMNKKILVVSPTNMAVENVFERLDFEKMGLEPGMALLTVRTENESLSRFAPKAVAQSKIKPINDELELLESAMVEILKTKRDSDSILSSLSSEEERTAISLSNLQKDEYKAKDTLKKAQAEFNELENRLKLLNSNVLIQTVAGAFLGTKLAEIESNKVLTQGAIASSETLIADIESKKAIAAKDRGDATQKLLDAKVLSSQADRSKKAVESRIDELKKEKEDILNLNLFGSAKLVGATLMAAALNKRINDAEFDIIVIDEASMASLPALVLACKAVNKSDVPLVEAKAYDGLYQAQSDAVNAALVSQFVFVGDPKQLSPIAKTKEMRTSIFETYGIEKIFKGEIVNHAILLDINFRNHPDIVELSSRLFYGGLLKSGREHNGKKALFIRNKKGLCSQFEGSYVNHGNADAVNEQVLSALTKGRRSIGVITPYRKQAENINIRLDKFRETYPDADMKAGTVYKFQGQEKGIVLFDITASSGAELPKTYVGDIDSEAGKLLNVAMTRAEDFFILVGDIDGLEKQLSHTQNHETLALWQWIQGIKELAYN